MPSTRNAYTKTNIASASYLSCSEDSVGYRFGFNSMPKDNEVAGSGNHYTAEYWEYSPRLARRWNPDPVVKFHEGPYACLGNNPIWYIDPNGADTINVIDKGIITSIKAAKGNHVLFDHNKKQLQFNYPEYDTELINKRCIAEGDKLVNYMSETETIDKVRGQGIIYNRIIASLLGETTMVGKYFYAKALFDIKEKSYCEWDFSHSVLGPMANAHQNSNLGKTEQKGRRTHTDDY